MKEPSFMETTKRVYFFTGIIFFAIFCLCVAINIVGPLLSDIMQYYSIQLNGGGLMTLFQNIGGTLAIILLSLVMDKLNKPATFIVPLVLMAVSMLMIGIVPPYAVFMLMFLFFGVSISTIDMMGNAIVPDIFPDKRNTALSLLHGIAPIGAVASPLFAGAVVTSGIAWQNVYLIIGCLVLLLAIIYTAAYFSFGKTLGACRVHESIKKDKGVLKIFIKDKRVLTAMGIMFGFASFQSGLIVWVSKYFSDMFGSSMLAAGLSLSAYWLGTCVVRVLFGITPLKRFNPRRVLMIGSIIAGLLLAIGIFSGNYYVMILSVLLAGCMNAPVIPLSVGLVGSWYPRYSALASSSVFGALYFAFSISPLIMGVIAYGLGMQAMMLVPAIFTVLAGLVAIFLPKDKPAGDVQNVPAETTF